MDDVTIYAAAKFLSTPSARRATADPRGAVATLVNFYPRPPRGGRRRPAMTVTIFSPFLSTPSARRATWSAMSKVTIKLFLSTPSARRATSSSLARACTPTYFYPRPPRGGRLSTRAAMQHRYMISIHALREEGDGRQAGQAAGRHHFYPRPPRGGRLSTKGIPAAAFRFLSTPSARRATAG